MKARVFRDALNSNSIDKVSSKKKRSDLRSLLFAKVTSELDYFFFLAAFLVAFLATFFFAAFLAGFFAITF